MSVDDQKVIGLSGSAPQTPVQLEQARAAAELGKQPPKATQTAKLSMAVKVHSPFRTYYDGVAFSLSAVNATGPFDILPRHHNFISLLEPCEVVVRTVSGEEQRIQINGGIMHVKADKVVVFLDV